MAATESVVRVTSWSAVEVEIDRIIIDSGDESFDSNTIANVRAFVGFAREHCLVPEVGKGYGSTVRFSWSSPPLEVEVFGNRFEVYRFHDGRTDIKEMSHAPGGPLPQEFVSLLPNRFGTE